MVSPFLNAIREAEEPRKKADEPCWGDLQWMRMFDVRAKQAAASPDEAEPEEEDEEELPRSLS